MCARLAQRILCAIAAAEQEEDEVVEWQEGWRLAPEQAAAACALSAGEHGPRSAENGHCARVAPLSCWFWVSRASLALTLPSLMIEVTGVGRLPSGSPHLGRSLSVLCEGAVSEQRAIACDPACPMQSSHAWPSCLPCSQF